LRRAGPGRSAHLPFIDEYLDAAGIRDAGKTPVFRSTAGRTGVLTDMPMRVDAARTAEAGL
jgi:hypothetical protein